jgi:hypothetical protein
MSAAFYNKYKSLFFDDNDPEPLSMNYFGVRPKNSLNIYPSQNLASLAQHYNILPKELDIPRAKVEELPSYPLPKPPVTKLDPLPYKPSFIENNLKQGKLDYYPEQVSSFKESPRRNNSIQKLPPIQQESFKTNLPSTSLNLPTNAGSFKEPAKIQDFQTSSPEIPKPFVENLRNASSFELKKQKYEDTKGNIFPDKPEPPKQLSPYQDAVKNRKDAKAKLAERKQRLKDLLAIDQMI